jgi:hypothetical protein
MKMKEQIILKSIEVIKSLVHMVQTELEVQKISVHGFKRRLLGTRNQHPGIDQHLKNIVKRIFEIKVSLPVDEELPNIQLMVKMTKYSKTNIFP